jgi:hypothetical protein
VSELVFNHHSLPYESAELVNNAVKEFLKICLKARRLGFPVILMDENQDINWFRIELAPGYFWQDWYKETGNRGDLIEQVRAFRSIATRKPLFPADIIGSDLALFDVREQGTGQCLSALRAAAWYDYPLVSFPTRNPWNQSPVSIIIETLSDNIQRQPGNLLNFYSISFLDSIEQQLLQQRNTSIQNSRTLWDQRLLNYPDLEFCGKSPGQLQNWSSLPSILNQAIQAFDVLQIFSEQWKNGIHDHYSHAALRGLGLTQEVSGESSSISNNPSKRKERTFYLSDGHRQYFENHIKLSHGFRIHFYPDSHARKIYIGYIGPHLSL